MKTLEELAIEYGTDKVQSGYLSYYENLLSYLCSQQVNLLEIGIAHGGSLRMWHDYFTQNIDTPGRIIGVDITDPGHLPGCEVVVADIKEIDDFGLLGNDELDIVIDDGSHYADDIMAAFVKLWPYVKSGGWYIIEDLGTQWWEGWAGSVGHSVPNGSIVTRWLGLQLDTILRNPVGVSEIHAFPYLVFLRKSSET
jgi:hypothetical protein